MGRLNAPGSHLYKDYRWISSTCTVQRHLTDRYFDRVFGVGMAAEGTGTRCRTSRSSIKNSLSLISTADMQSPACEAVK